MWPPYGGGLIGGVNGLAGGLVGRDVIEGESGRVARVDETT